MKTGVLNKRIIPIRGITNGWNVYDMVLKNVLIKIYLYLPYGRYSVVICASHVIFQKNDNVSVH